MTFIVFTLCVLLGSVCFGIWQHSAAAMFFVMFTLMALAAFAAEHLDRINKEKKQ